MRTARQALVVGTFAVLAAACQPAAEAPETTAQAATEADNALPELTSDGAKASYMAGFSLANSAAAQLGDNLDADALLRGLTDRLEDAESAVSPEDARAAMTAIAQVRQQEIAASAAENAKAGAAFLAENGQREGVVTTDSGLQYEVLEQGDGAKPKATDTVTTHYEGRLLNGEVFDSSIKRGQPASFPLNRVISGWTEGLQLMAVGSKYRFYIPAELAYGNRATGGIPPQSTLTFDVELLDIAGAPEE